MKRTWLSLSLLLFASLAVADENAVVLRGQSVSDGPAVAISELMADPAGYAKEPVVIEGVIQASCDRKGCWMQLASAKDNAGLRVTFKDYGFFIPLDARGMGARAEGVVSVRNLSKEEADHLESEGAKLNRAADGTVREISFIASGVELRKQ